MRYLFPEFRPAFEAHPVGIIIPLCLAAGVLYAMYKVLASLAALKNRSTTFYYLPWEELQNGGHESDTVVTDCTHPTAPTLSHHKGHKNPHGLKTADTSTGIVLNATGAQVFLGGEPAAYCTRRYISANHFDVDSFLSVWCYCNRDQARAHAPVLRHMARIGDFREALLSPELVSAHGAEDGLTNVRDAFTALKLCCWLNSLEKRMFTAPYESKDATQKFNYFLPIFGSVLEDPEAAWDVWSEEYKAVVGGFDALSGGQSCSVDVHKSVGLAVLRAPEPMHYYALFSQTCGCDYVLSMYDDNRYELECKYTQFVQVHSRPVAPRFDLTPLATVLNSIEGDENKKAGMYWVAPRFTDSGPVLRLESSTERLTKAQRYGHPTGRQIATSAIPHSVMSAVVISFLEFGMQGLRPRRGGFSWDELHRIHQDVPWKKWVNAVLSEHESGELLGRSGGVESGRRFSMDALPLEPATTAPPLSEPSRILSDSAVRMLAGTALPGHLCFGAWRLAFCSARDGYSLQQLYRKAAGLSHTLLVVQDTGGHVFGAFASEPWRVHPRFYGTGETSVFQVHPRQLLWRWNHVHGATNDYFQFSTHEGLGVGGAGHFAVWLDNDLFEGSSNDCDTFASRCLASSPDFHVQALELWHVA